MIFSIYIYNRKSECIYYESWNRKAPPANLEEEQKLMYGLLWQIKQFVQKSSPFPTNTYKLHFFETASNLKFALLTDPDTVDLREFLKNIYKNVFVEYVIKNPLYKIGEPIRCELFIENLNKEIKSLPAFKSISNPMLKATH